MSYGLAQARYASDATATVPAGRLLTMLYDRLVQNLSVAESALRSGDVAATGDRLGQAQEILLELRATLDVSIWPEGEALGRIYLWIVAELSQARLRCQPQRIADCRELIEPLRDAWHEAARSGARGAGAPPALGFGGAA
jgi:flagellar secretion chaperone FliS